MVKLYALSTCPWCKKTKQLLEAKGIAFDFLDVDLAAGLEQENAINEVRRLTGDTSFPVAIVGDKVIAGYKPEELLRAIEHEG